MEYSSDVIRAIREADQSEGGPKPPNRTKKPLDVGRAPDRNARKRPKKGRTVA